MIKNEDERVRIGARIAELRKAVKWDEVVNGITVHHTGMTQVQLAERCGIRQSNLARIECGRYATTVDVLSSIAAVLGVKLDFVELR